jgi:hypothetical protein
MALMVLALLVADVSSAAHHRVVTSAHSFQRYFEDLKGARNSISPLERFVFSVVLATADPYPAEQQ